MTSYQATRQASILVIALLTAGCASAPVKGPLPAMDPVRNSIAERALAMVGAPYRYGSADPHAGFDCSGLVYYAYTSNGQAVPRTSQSQYEAARKITLAQATKGDLVFFRDQEKLSHVGIYLGRGRFVHAPSSGGSVRVDDFGEPYYQRHLVAAGQLLP